MRDGSTQPGAAACGRSAFVTAVAWTFIVLGVAGTLASLQSVYYVFAAGRWRFMRPVPSGLPLTVMAVRLYFAYWPVLVAARLVVCASGLIAAVGLLRRKQWGRRLFIAILVLGILAFLGAFILQLATFSSHSMSLWKSFPVLGSLPRAAVLVASLAVQLAACVVLVWIVRRLTSPRYRREFRTRPKR